MSYIESNEDSSDIALIVSDLKQLDNFIDSQKQPADTFTTCSVPSDRPEDYLTTGFPMFDSVPHDLDLIATMLSRATSAISVLITALEGSTGPFMWQCKHDLLWNVCSQLDMVDVALKRVTTEPVT